MASPVSCLIAISCWGLALPAHAQAPVPSKAASATATQQRSQDPTYNVYRWITMHADTPRKTEPVKPRPKVEVAAPAPRRPEVQAAALETRLEQPAADVPAPITSTPVATTSDESAPQAQTSAAPAASALAPAAEVAVAKTATTPAASAAAKTSEAPEGDLKLISQTPPEFPRELRNSVAEGKVVVSFTVQPDGTVAEPTVVSKGNRRLGKAATDAVAKWLFEPIRVARTVKVEIAFNAQ